MLMIWAAVGAAAAEPEPPSRFHAIAAGVGIHTAGVGLAYTFRPADRWAIQAALGSGLSLYGGFAFQVRWFPPRSVVPVYLALGAGPLVTIEQDQSLPGVQQLYVDLYGPTGAVGLATIRQALFVNASIGVGIVDYGIFGQVPYVTADLAFGVNFGRREPPDPEE